MSVDTVLFPIVTRSREIIISESQIVEVPSSDKKSTPRREWICDWKDDTNGGLPFRISMRVKSFLLAGEILAFSPDVETFCFLGGQSTGVEADIIDEAVEARGTINTNTPSSDSNRCSV